MPVFQQGAINTTALIVPDVYVQIVPPSNLVLNGVPTNVLGIIGTAQWGPANSPVIVSNLNDYVQRFGNIMPRKYDMGTAVWAAILNGASNFRCVRVTDSTDVAASAVVGTLGVTVTAKYTGTLGNGVVATVSAGSQTGTWRVTIALANNAPEVFDNIGLGLTANALWIAIAAALNNGTSSVRGASAVVVATAGAGTSAPVAGSTTLSGGTDGATTITAAVELGQDTIPRKGMYALRGTGASIAVLADADDSTSWTSQNAYGLSEGTYMILTGPAGDTIANAVTAKGTAGIDSYSAKLMFGDWCYFNDTVNNQPQRLVSPQGFIAGKLSSLAPQESGLNKPLFGIVGTQKSYASQTYSAAELQTLAQAGIDVLANPIPAGASFGSRLGCNTSSNGVINGDNYPRLTNYIAYTLNAGMGLYIGKLQSPKVQSQANSTISTFLANMQAQGMIGVASDIAAQAFSVQLNLANNPPSRVALGYMQIDVRITYLSVVTKLLINVEGGQSVVISAPITTAQ
jgi:hypothetical protein